MGFPDAFKVRDVAFPTRHSPDPCGGSAPHFSCRSRKCPRPQEKSGFFLPEGIFQVRLCWGSFPVGEVVGLLSKSTRKGCPKESHCREFWSQVNHLPGGYSGGLSSSPQTSLWQSPSWPSLASSQPQVPSPPPTSTLLSSSPPSSGEVSPPSRASFCCGS